MSCGTCLKCADVCNCINLYSQDGSIIAVKNGCNINVEIDSEHLPEYTITYDIDTNIICFIKDGVQVVCATLDGGTHQTLTISGSVISLSGAGGSVDICPAVVSCQTAWTGTSGSLVITPSGTAGHAPHIELVPSVDANNILTLGTDGHPYVPATNCTSLSALFATDAAQKNGVTQTVYDFLITGVMGCQKVSPPLGFAVSGTTRLSAFGSMEWYSTLTLANAAAVSGETVLLFVDTAENLVPKNGVNYQGIGQRTIGTIISSALCITNLFNLTTGNVSFTGTNSEVICTSVVIVGNLTVAGTKWHGGQILDKGIDTLIATVDTGAVVDGLYSQSYVQVRNGGTLYNSVIDLGYFNNSFLAALMVLGRTTNSITSVSNVTINGHLANGLYADITTDDSTISIVDVNCKSIDGKGLQILVSETITSGLINIVNVTAESVNDTAAYFYINSLVNTDFAGSFRANIVNVTGFSKNGEGIRTGSAPLNNCHGFSENSYGIYMNTGGQTKSNYYQTRLVDCTGESLNIYGLYVERNCYISGGTYISHKDDSTGNPIFVSNVHDDTTDYHYSIVGVNTIAKSSVAYAIAGNLSPSVLITKCNFLNPEVAPGAVLGIDVTTSGHIVPVTPTLDAYGNTH